VELLDKAVNERPASPRPRERPVKSWPTGPGSSAISDNYGSLRTMDIMLTSSNRALTSLERLCSSIRRLDSSVRGRLGKHLRNAGRLENE
jgi:hypothetical protein